MPKNIIQIDQDLFGTRHDRYLLATTYPWLSNSDIYRR